VGFGTPARIGWDEPVAAGNFREQPGLAWEAVKSADAMVANDDSQRVATGPDKLREIEGFKKKMLGVGAGRPIANPVPVEEGAKLRVGCDLNLAGLAFPSFEDFFKNSREVVACGILRGSPNPVRIFKKSEWHGTSFHERPLSSTAAVRDFIVEMRSS
jgi:hypothetical protein